MDAIVTIAVAIVGASAGFLASYVALRKQKADAAATTFEEALKLLELHKAETAEAKKKIKEQDERITELEGRVETLEGEVAEYAVKTDELRVGIRILQRQLRELGAQPDFEIRRD